MLPHGNMEKEPIFRSSGCSDITAQVGADRPLTAFAIHVHDAALAHGQRVQARRHLWPLWEVRAAMDAIVN